MKRFTIGIGMMAAVWTATSAHAQVLQARATASSQRQASSAAQQDDIARGFSAGATDYLTKPFSPVRLLSLVERLAPRLAWPPA